MNMNILMMKITRVLYTDIQSPGKYIISLTSLTGVMQMWSTFHREVEFEKISISSTLFS